jgi:hypothetical protein
MNADVDFILIGNDEEARRVKHKIARSFVETETTIKPSGSVKVKDIATVNK